MMHYEPNILDELYSELTAEWRNKFINELENSNKETRESVLTNLFSIDAIGFNLLVKDLTSINKVKLIEEATLIQAIQMSLQSAKEEALRPAQKEDSTINYDDLIKWENEIKEEGKKPRTNKEILADIREQFEDPDLMEVITNPFITPQGSTYQSEHIRAWIKKKKQDPVDYSPLCEKDLRPNKIFSQLRDYFTKDPVDILIFPPCLYDKKTKQLFVNPVVNSNGETIERPTSSAKINYYQNIVVEKIITLIKEALANNNIQEKKPHSSKLFTKTYVAPSIYLLNETEHHFIGILSKSISTLNQNNSANENGKQVEAISTLIDILRKKASIEMLEENLLSIFETTHLKNTIPPILTYIQNRDIKKPEVKHWWQSLSWNGR